MQSVITYSCSCTLITFVLPTPVDRIKERFRQSDRWMTAMFPCVAIDDTTRYGANRPACKPIVVRATHRTSTGLHKLQLTTGTQLFIRTQLKTQSNVGSQCGAPPKSTYSSIVRKPLFLLLLLLLLLLKLLLKHL